MSRQLAAGTLLIAIGSICLAMWVIRTSSIPRAAGEASTLELPFVPASFGAEGDPQARQKYEHMLLADPATGRIPAGMRLKAMEYCRQLPGSSSLQTRLTARSYIHRGPFNVGGRTRALAIDITNEQVLLAGGVSGGMWRSTNQGISWERTTPPDMINSISCLVQDTRQGKEPNWYFGTGEYSLFNSARANNITPYRGDGIYKSTDGGLTWLPLSATVLGNVSTFGSPFQYVYKLAINTSNQVEDELYAATVGGILRSADGGTSWQTVLGQDLLISTENNLNAMTFPFFTDIAITKSGTKYAAIGTLSNKNNDWPGAGIYTSGDGISWSKITPPGFPVQYGRILITPSPANNNVVYYLVNAPTPHLFKSTWLPAAESFTWTDLTNNIPDLGGKVGKFDTQGGYNMLLEIHPENENVIFIGGTNLYRSTDGFSSTANTAWIGGYATSNNVQQYPGHHADQHALTFFPSNSSKVLSGHDGGVSLTDNSLSNEVKWISLNNGYLTSQFFTIDIPKFEYSDLIVGGMQDNGTYLRSAPGEMPPWEQIFSGDGSYCQVADGGKFWYVSAQQAQIYRLTFNSKYRLTAFGRVDPLPGGQNEDGGYLFINPFRINPANHNVMYLAGGSVLWLNSNLSQIPNGSQEKTNINWIRLEASQIPQGLIAAIDLPTTGKHYILYGTTTGHLYKLTPLGNNQFVQKDVTSPEFPRGFISSISIDPSNSTRVMVCFSNFLVTSVFYSEDSGETFSDISGNLEENPDGSGNGPSVRWVQIVPLQTGESMAFAGTGSGLFASEKISGNTTKWTREGENAIGFGVVPMLSYNPLDGRLAIATHGNGVFETTVSGIAAVTKPTGPPSFAVGHPYPNPFHQKINISVDIPTTQTMRALVYDTSGRLVKTLAWGTHFGGEVTVTWDGTNVSGSQVIDGVYICRIQLQSGDEKAVRLILRH